MKRHLEKLRSKPDEHKKRIVKILAISTTVLIIILWIAVRSLVPKTASTPSATGFFESINGLFDESFNQVETLQQEFSEQSSIFNSLEQELINEENTEI